MVEKFTPISIQRFQDLSLSASQKVNCNGYEIEAASLVAKAALKQIRKDTKFDFADLKDVDLTELEYQIRKDLNLSVLPESVAAALELLKLGSLSNYYQVASVDARKSEMYNTDFKQENLKYNTNKFNLYDLDGNGYVGNNELDVIAAQPIGFNEAAKRVATYNNGDKTQNVELTSANQFNELLFTLESGISKGLQERGLLAENEILYGHIKKIARDHVSNFLINPESQKYFKNTDNPTFESEFAGWDIDKNGDYNKKDSEIEDFLSAYLTQFTLDYAKKLRT